MVEITLQRRPKIKQHKHHYRNNGGKLRCSEMVNCSSSTSGTHRVNLVTNPVISHECFLVGFVLLNLPKIKEKNTNNGRNNPTEKTKDQATQTPLQKLLKTSKWCCIDIVRPNACVFRFSA
jgi:hypothetical protein